MAIMQLTRFKSDDREKMIKTAKEAKKVFEKHGAEFLRLSRFHTGTWAGEWLVSTRYSSWQVYGKAQDGLANDEAFAKLQAHLSTFAELTVIAHAPSVMRRCGGFMLGFPGGDYLDDKRRT